MKELVRWIARALSLSSGTGTIMLDDLKQRAAGMVQQDGRYGRSEDTEDEAHENLQTLLLVGLTLALKRLVRLCIRHQGRYLCDDADEGPSGNIRFRVGCANPPRVVAPVEEPNDVDLLPALLEGQGRYDHQV